jgi:hypothetical protein
LYFLFENGKNGSYQVHRKHARNVFFIQQKQPLPNMATFLYLINVAGVDSSQEVLNKTVNAEHGIIGNHQILNGVSLEICY